MTKLSDGRLAELRERVNRRTQIRGSISDLGDLLDALHELSEYRNGSRDDLSSKVEAIQQAHDEIAELVGYRKSGDGTVQVTWPSMSERLDGITDRVIELRSYAVVPYSRSIIWSSPDQALTDLRKWREEVSGDDETE